MPGIEFVGLAEYDERSKSLIVRVPTTYEAAVARFSSSQKEKHSGYMSVTVTKPMRRRTTGYRSQNTRFRGHCQDIADQLVTPDGESIYSADSIAMAFKRMAMSEGYPWGISLDGLQEPASTTKVTLEEMKILLDVQQRFADEHGFYLTEYDEENHPYRSVGGRTKEEMESYD